MLVQPTLADCHLLTADWHLIVGIVGAGSPAAGSAGSTVSVSCGWSEPGLAGPAVLSEQDLERHNCNARCSCVGSPAGEAFCAAGDLDDLGIDLVEVGLGSDDPSGFG